MPAVCIYICGKAFLTSLLCTLNEVAKARCFSWRVGSCVQSCLKDGPCTSSWVGVPGSFAVTCGLF